jgi:hypothetical protein
MERLNMYQKEVFIPLKLDFTSNMNYCYLKQFSENWQLNEEINITISISPPPQSGICMIFEGMCY